eukprot:11000716-Heterocapsa_arctica.AAC.1
MSRCLCLILAFPSEAVSTEGLPVFFQVASTCQEQMFFFVLMSMSSRPFNVSTNSTSRTSPPSGAWVGAYAVSNSKSGCLPLPS